MLVELTDDELCMINNGMNEVCNDIDLKGSLTLGGAVASKYTVEEAGAVLHPCSAILLAGNDIWARAVRSWNRLSPVPPPPAEGGRAARHADSGWPG